MKLKIALTLVNITPNKDISSSFKNMNIKGYKIHPDNFEEQTSPQGKKFRYSGTGRTSNGWMYRFKYLDGSGMFAITTDKNDNYKTTIK
jgi:hypothetical protein